MRFWRLIEKMKEKTEVKMEKGTVALTRVTYETVSEEYSGGRMAYGIAVCENGLPIEVISDISDDRKAIDELVELCNSSELAPYHIRDVIDDFLSK